MSLVTIAIPCFNAAPWVRMAVESALAQTCGDCEIIVVDDGSTDGSREVLREFEGLVEVVPGEHRGAPSARNLALEMAAGEWIQFLDADDFLLPEKIDTQLAQAGDEQDDADILFAPTLIEEDGRRREQELDPDLDLYSQWLLWQMPQTGGALWRSRYLRDIGGWKPDQPCCQEHELYLRALQNEAGFVQTPSALAVYRVWSLETLCRKDVPMVIRERTKLMHRLIIWLRRHGRFTPAHRQAAGRAFFEMARTLMKYNRREALDYYREHQRQGLIHAEGPAAPRHYRIVHRMLGFRMAEKLAETLR